MLRAGQAIVNIYGHTRRPAGSGRSGSGSVRADGSSQRRRRVLVRVRLLRPSECNVDQATDVMAVGGGDMPRRPRRWAARASGGPPVTQMLSLLLVLLTVSLGCGRSVGGGSIPPTRRAAGSGPP